MKSPGYPSPLVLTWTLDKIRINRRKLCKVIVAGNSSVDLMWWSAANDAVEVKRCVQGKFSLGGILINNEY